MIIDPTTLDRRQRHQLLLSTVAPRPIAWVSTRGLDGSYNLAPFSYFQALCSTPPYLMISVGKREGSPKDTLRNIQDTSEYVVNLVPESLAEPMNLSAGEYDAHVDEFALGKLTPVVGEAVAAPRVAESPVSMEVKLHQLIPLPGSDYTAVIGEVVRWHVADGVLTPKGLIDIARLRPISRLAQDDYVTFGDVFSMSRPRVE
jgi:flavin reductase (DIM6/NTAB) family NADH-FMN oxidoreductase RutF